MLGLEGRDVTREEDQIPDPVFDGPAGLPRVGIVEGGLGSRSLVPAVRSFGRYQVAPVEGVAKSPLAACDAIIFPERRIPATFTKQQCWLIWDWVAAGGRLMLTHDAVGYRHHPILFPWVCSGGTAHVETPDIDVVWAPDGGEPAGIIRPAYREHILLQPCIRAQMTLIATDVASGRPTVTGASFETGKVMACGIALGVDAQLHDAPPNPGEMQLLQAMLAWLMQ